jgi:hypothetical protein
MAAQILKWGHTIGGGGFGSTSTLPFISDCLHFESLQRLIDFFRIEQDRPVANFQEWNLPPSHERPQGPNRNSLVPT